ncbi:MAG: glycosyltransferase family 4 protein [Bryobacteraceae bacterium]
MRSAGVKTYVYHWTRALRRLAGEAVSLFPFVPFVEDCPLDRSVLPRLATWSRLALLHLANGSPLPILNALGSRVGVFHASHQLVRPPRNTRLTATLYDMTCWLVPEMHAPANVAAAKRFAREVLTRADGLIAISEHTRADAVRILDLDPDRVTVIYPGVSEDYFDARPAARGKPYALFVGTIEPRKNVATLLDAWEQLPPGVRAEFDLVVAGPAGWGDPSVLARLASSACYLGYVPERDLPGLVAGAAVFVYPSLYEGFGLPIAQAMAARVPVIASNVSSMPEVAGAGGLLVDPRSAADLSLALARLLISPSLRSSLGSEGRARAERYRWSECARASWRFFQQVAE